jgi:hypothetical protein
MIIKHNHRKLIIKDVRKCKGINQFIGLMFKPKDTNALLFEFSSSTNMKIHSLFCKPFLAIWLDSDDKVIETKIIDKIGIFSPKKGFFKLLELPLNKNYIPVIKILSYKEKV